MNMAQFSVVPSNGVSAVNTVALESPGKNNLEYEAKNIVGVLLVCVDDMVPSIYCGHLLGML